MLLPPIFTGGYFAAAVVLVVDRFGQMFYRLGCVAQMDALSPLYLETVGILVDVVSFRRQ